jgi:hypothetical protein
MIKLNKIIDLRERLQKCHNFRPNLIQNLKHPLETRLLHTASIRVIFIIIIKIITKLSNYSTKQSKIK